VASPSASANASTSSTEVLGREAAGRHVPAGRRVPRASGRWTRNADASDGQQPREIVPAGARRAMERHGGGPARRPRTDVRTVGATCGTRTMLPPRIAALESQPAGVRTTSIAKSTRDPRGQLDILGRALATPCREPVGPLFGGRHVAGRPGPPPGKAERARSIAPRSRGRPNRIRAGVGKAASQHVGRRSSSYARSAVAVRRHDQAGAPQPAGRPGRHDALRPPRRCAGR